MDSAGMRGEVAPSGPPTACARMHRPAAAAAPTLDKSSISTSKHRLNDGVFFVLFTQLSLTWQHYNAPPPERRQALDNCELLWYTTSRLNRGEQHDSYHDYRTQMGLLRMWSGSPTEQRTEQPEHDEHGLRD